MSSILKALKKVEDDKAGRRQGELKIDAEILRSDNSPRFSPAVMVIASLLLLAGGSGATYLYMKQGAVPRPSSSKREAVTRQSSFAVSPVVDIKTEQLPPAVVIVPANQDAKANTKAITLPKRSAVPKTVTTVKSSHPSSTIPAVPPLPALRVNGIALQNNAADSMAIVNGTPVSIGSTIEGVTVEEIRKDKVLFQRNGEKFGIQLGQSNR